MNIKKKLSTFVFLILIVVILMDSALLIPNQVLIAADLNILFDTIGLITGIYIISSGISVLILGSLMDVIDRKKILIFTGFLWSFTAMAHVLVVEVWILVLLRILAAISTGVATPLAISYLTDMVSSEKRSKAFAFWVLIETIGGLIGGSLALTFNQIPYSELEYTYLYEVNTILANIRLNYSNILWTWRLPFLLFGFIALIFTILNVFLAIEPKKAVKEKYLEEILTDDLLQYSYKIEVSDIQDIFKRKSNLFLILNLFDVVGTGIILTYLFPYIELDIQADFGDPTGVTAMIILLLGLIPLGLLIGQFGFAHLGDKKFKKGDLTGRVKIATICGIFNIPFLLIGFSMTPNIPNKTFFFGTVSTTEVGFWIFWIIYTLLLGVGLGFSLGIAPNWYSSLIDANLPEHRGTVIALGAFVDTFGRALGAMLGGYLVTLAGNFALTLFWTTLISGIFSIMMWIPLFFTSKKDFLFVDNIMKERANNLKKEK